MELTVNVKLDMSGFKAVEKACEALSSSKIQSGVLEADSETLAAAYLNEFGGETEYTDGKYAGEKVLVPPRSFVRAAAEIEAPNAFRKAKEILSDGLTKENANKAIISVAEDISKAQRDALENNGEKIPNWVKHNDPRTIETKGFDQPLWSRRGETFPISYEVTK